MKLLALIEFLRQRLKGVILACYGVLGILVVIDAVRWFSGGHHEAAGETAHGFWTKLLHIAESWPGFWAAFGFVACTAIIFLSKWYGHLGIMTREDYYDE